MQSAAAAAGQADSAASSAAEMEPSEEQLSRWEAKPLPPLLRELSAFAGRAVLCLAPVYLAGYLGLSTIWVLVGLFIWMWWRRNRREKQSRLLAAFGLAEDEKQAISQGIALQQLPAWVSSAKQTLALSFWPEGQPGSRGGLLSRGK